jgi:hypothetical protein
LFSGNYTKAERSLKWINWILDVVTL